MKSSLFHSRIIYFSLCGMCISVVMIAAVVDVIPSPKAGTDQALIIILFGSGAALFGWLTVGV